MSTTLRNYKIMLIQMRIKLLMKVLLPRVLRVVLYKLYYSCSRIVNLAIFWCFRSFRGDCLYNHKLGVKFYIPNFRSFERARYAHQKEPITRHFISELAEGSTFWDIGSNIGLFGILGAKRKGVKTVCFEPLPANFFILAKNVELNPEVSEQIVIVPLPLTNVSRVEALCCPLTEAGYSGVQFGRSIDESGNEFENPIKINLLGMTGASVSEILPNGFSRPTHIKLDVDGIELEILHGLGDLLRNDALRAVLVEININLQENYFAIQKLLNDNGFYNDVGDREQTVLAHSDPSCYNYIFRRA